VAWPDRRVVLLDRRLLVVDKPVGLPIHGGNPEIADVVTRLARALRERGEDEHLSVHSRLDQDVSGLVMFVRDTSLDPEVARLSERHAIVRGYRAIVERCDMPERFVMEDRLLCPDKGLTRCVKSGGLFARTRVERLLDRGKYSLLSLYPETGRRHQLRAQLAARGAPILGDRTYGGAAAPRLMLHSTELRCPELDLELCCTPPPQMQLEPGRTQPEAEELERLIFDAAWRRSGLERRSEAYRLVNGGGDELEGLVLDRFGDHAVLEFSLESTWRRRSEILRAVSALGPQSIYVKHRVRADLRHCEVSELGPAHPELGEPAPSPLIVEENGMRLAVDLGDGFDTGLYVDQRDNRARVRAAARDRDVLNLFGYTGGFSVAAALGGARSTTTIDLSQRALHRARRNLEHNGIQPSAAHRLLRAEVTDWLRRALARERRYSLVILDPPSFSTSRGGVFRLSRAWPTLLASAVSLLEDGGELLVVSHEHERTQAALRNLVRAAVEGVGRRIDTLVELPNGSDCPSHDRRPSPSLSVWLRLGTEGPARRAR